MLRRFFSLAPVPIAVATGYLAALAAILGGLLNLPIPGRPRAIDPDEMFRPVEHRPAG